MKLRILSYNIHKGFDSFGTKFVLDEIKKAIQLVSADIVFLQEVHGHHSELSLKTSKGVTNAQFEYLADQIWTHFSYGKNAVYKKGNHGNAILSKFPILFSENINISTNRFEKRGLLHCTVEIADQKVPLHLINLHLNLLESARTKQAKLLIERLNSHVPKEHPLIVAGDFNDWREKLTHLLKAEAQLDEVFMKVQSNHPKTYPSFMPILSLDRMFYRKMNPVTANVLSGNPWKQLSDHLAIFAEFEF